MNVTQDETISSLRDGAAGYVPTTEQRRHWAADVALVIVVLLGLFAFLGAYYVRAYSGALDRRACDHAQIARNISSGTGFETSFIRPFNVSFMEVGMTSFPEMNNAPLFPYTVAAAFKFRGVADQTVVQVSLIFFALTVVATFWLGAILFDFRSGLFAGAIVCLSAPVLKIASSGQEWMAATLWVTLLFCLIALYHKGHSTRSVGGTVAYAALCALLIGLAYATHYAFVFFGIPLGVYFARTGRWRRTAAAVFLVLGVLLVLPLAYRNYTLTGCPVLGVTAWDMMANSRIYPDDIFYRSVRSDVSNIGTLLVYPINHFSAFGHKFLQGCSELTATMISMLGLMGLPFAAASTLYRFKQSHTNAVRGLGYGLGAVFVLVFGVLGVPAQCVVALCPLVAVIAAGYLFLLLAARKFHRVFVRFVVTGAILITVCPALVQIIWPLRATEGDVNARLAQSLASARHGVPIYSGQPWTVAWRTLNPSVWLPITDFDVVEMEAVGLPMDVIVMTPECRSYPKDDLWRALYTVPKWLNYVLDPGTTAEALANTAGVAEEHRQQVSTYLSRHRRAFRISAESLNDMKQFENVYDPLQPNDILIIHR